MGEPSNKRSRPETEDEDESQKRKRALAAMMLLQQQNQQQADPPPTKTPAAAPTAQASIPHGAAQGEEQIDEAQDEFQDDMETWAADHDERDIHQFEAEGQDFSHLLQTDELHWEDEAFAKALPPGWAKCPNSGQMIMDMLPTKAPYGGQKGQRVPGVYQWKPSDVHEHLCTQHGKRLGAVIDLTMSTRYYKADEFERLNVRYVKIPCKGHGETPSPAEVNRFVWAVQCEKGRLQTLWEQEKKLLVKHDLDVKEYEEQKAAALQAGQPFDKKHPLLKMPRIERGVVEGRELVAQGPAVIVVHCTHGYNRSGFMFCHYMKRFGPALSVAACVKAFEAARAPGMYKDEYIQQLFEYYHEERDDEQTQTPMLPAWKADDGEASPEHFGGLDGGANATAGGAAEMSHDDKVGEDISPEEAEMYKREVVTQLRQAFLHLVPEPGDEDGMTYHDVEKVRRKSQTIDFPGSQPVSLSASNQHLIYKHRYWFSWKADGTRYMVYISNSGTYLIDRRMCVTRVQMRFPLWLRQGTDTEDMQTWMQKFMQGKLERPSRVHPTLSRLHHGTLVDGEMVVNELPDGTKQRVFYMYDLMMLNGANVVGLPWKSRYMLMTTEVVDARNEERKRREAEDNSIKQQAEEERKRNALRKMQGAAGGAAAPHAASESASAGPITRKWTYDYDGEPFEVQGKTFWPLHELESCRKHFFKTLAHENDGLILQAYQSRYVPDACQMLLKWKPASHNSVDFTLLPADHELVSSCAECEQALTQGQEYFLGVYGDGRVVLAFDLDHAALKKLGATQSLSHAVTTVPARVQFPGGEDPDEFAGLVVECNFDSESHSWCFMRDRTKDKDYPNGMNTYLRVVKSIVSAIDDEGITEQFELAYKLAQDKYKKDIIAQQHALRRNGR